MRIGGVLVQYYFACKRELWFFARHINMNIDNEDVLLGKLIHEKSYRDEKKSILIDDTIAIDFMHISDNLIVFEIKKSSRLPEPVRWQLLYYLWYLKTRKGIDAKGIIVYPKERKREEIELTEDIKEKFNHIINEIKEIINLDKPPKPVKKPYCRKCSYRDLCWV